MAARKEKKEGEPYTFSELSEKAKDVAIKEYRDQHSDQLFDHSDSQFLTEVMENDLKDHYGLGDFKAYWSLGHCQGDGVCFEGTVDLETFINAEKVEERFGTLVGLVRAKVKHESRYCHWNGMTIEVEGEASPEHLLSAVDHDQYSNWQYASRSRNRERIEVEFRRTLPIRQWQEQVAEWRAAMKKKHHTKQDWTPRVLEPRPQPQELDIPMPPKIEMPEDLKAAWDQAELEVKRFEQKVKEFEEYLTARVKEISKELEKNGYAEIDHHYSDEYIAERLETDDQEYNKAGTLYDED